ncbi:2-C-methyl-D-erythritol 2,4-cyclodiphosphate synthase [Patescibacteria group bacterium]|nr:2-C-methyl-D-erythritol 2,4-cyclodiphosphate synthase [Patescibacteria group bacterium]MCL5091371.1 2-C-methyl-D-erythritol 2,4-cyclodiphosphate synthase [Patescibacteria group bacterium]
MNKVGIGQDSHRFAGEKKPLVLGGVTLASSGGLQANSDGDVILHSLCNAISSAVGGDSLGTWADSMCLKQGIKDSRKFLTYIYEKVAASGYRVVNLAVSVEAKLPRLTMAQIKKIKVEIARLVHVRVGQVGITFTSGEDLTAFGRGDGVQAWSIVNLAKDA